MRLYIADDNIEFANFCGKVARSAGWTVTITHDGAELLQELRREQGPALVLCDINMPGVDGIEVIQQLRDINRPLMVRVMTGGVLADAIAAELMGKAYGLIAGRFLYKPVAIEDLRASLTSDQELLVKTFGHDLLP